MQMFRVNIRILFTVSRTAFRQLLFSTLTHGTARIQWTILGSIGLIVRQMQAVLSLWKYLRIATAFPLIAVDPVPVF